MKSLFASLLRPPSLLPLCLAISIHLAVALPTAKTAQAEANNDPKQVQRLGERIFREGILPGGERLQAIAEGGAPLPGTTFACAGCHLRSGLGAFDEGFYTPAINGATLFKPLNSIPERSSIERNRTNVVKARRRPAYTDRTLAEALRTGVDPAGRAFSSAMPRYILADGEMSVLISYLRSLSSEQSPGFSNSVLKLATVITEDANPEERDAMLSALFGFVDTRNRQARLLKQLKTAGKGRMQVMGGDMMTPLRTQISLSPWVLRGPPGTWRKQLEDYYREEPIFALIGGIAAGDWKPIHDFSEENMIPCLFPSTEFPVISQTGWYTLYLSKGFYQEGDAAAQYLSGVIKEGGRVLQLVRDTPEGRALSEGFLEAWHHLGHEPPVTVTLKGKEQVSQAVLGGLLGKEKPAAVVLWDGVSAPEELDSLFSSGDRPQLAVISSKYVDKNVASLKEVVRDCTYISYAPRFSWQNHSSLTIGPNASGTRDPLQIGDEGYLFSQIFSIALMEMKTNYYRDHLLDVIGMLGEVQVPLHGTLSFGSGPRYADKRNYIVQLSKGGTFQLVVKKEIDPGMAN